MLEFSKTASGYDRTPTALLSFSDATGGSVIYAGLIADPKGDLFGVTSGEGSSLVGKVFEIAKTADGYASKPTLLGSLEELNSLTVDANGDLFVTTGDGGADDVGAVFEIVKTASGYDKTMTLLASFDGADGIDPTNGGMIVDAKGDLFGTTYWGGSFWDGDLSLGGLSDGSGGGTVFEVAKTASGYDPTPIVLASPDPEIQGSISGGALIADAAGDLFGSTNSAGGDSQDSVFEIANTGFFVTPPCFLAGTRIMTALGEMAVEALRPSMMVPTRLSGTVPIAWIGSRRIDCRRHPDPQQTYPIRIAAGAFARGRPHRDLYLSPDHAIYVDGALIPAKLLVNGATIAREPRDQVTYYHVELARHDVLLAEGLPCESYLDTGNRGAFANAQDARVLHPDFAVHAWDDTCVKMVLDGPVLACVRERLLKRASRLGHRRRTDPGLRLMLDGRAKRPGRRDGNRCIFTVPRGAKEIRLVSDAGVPAEVLASSRDVRRLGVSIDRIVVYEGQHQRVLALDDPALAGGWHQVERDGDYAWRWTDGDAWLALHAQCRVEITVVGSLPGWVSGRQRPRQPMLKSA